MKKLILLLTLFVLVGCKSNNEIKISGEKIIYLNQTIQLQVEGLSNTQYDWKSDDQNIADVQNGEVLGKNTGKTKISILVNEKVVASHKIEVKEVGVLTLTTSKEIIQIGDQLELSVNSNYNDDQFIWSSSNHEVATVEKGIVTGINEGIVIIKVQSTSQGMTTVEVQVVASFIPESIEVTNVLERYYIGEVPYQLDAVVYPAYASQEVEWIVSGKKATINKDTGEIIFHEDGMVYVTCRSKLSDQVYNIVVLDVQYLDSEVTNIMFIGNSLTYVNDIPKMVENMAKASGKIVRTERVTPGGNTLEQILTNYKGTIVNALKKRQFDYVVIQEASAHNFLNLPSFLSSATKIKELTDMYQAELLLYQTWAYRDQGEFLKMYNLERVTMQNLINSSYEHVSNELGVRVNRVGEIFYAFSLDYPEIELYKDENHASLAGSYLSSCVHYVSIFNESVVGNTYDVGLDAQTKLLIQTYVSEYLLNNQ